MRDQSDIVAAVLALKDTPFLHQGRVAGLQGGTDCVGEVILVARATGRCAPDFDVTGYTRQPDGTLLALLDRYLVRINASDMAAGDVVAFVVDKEPQHVGILVDRKGGGFNLVHASIKDRRIVEQRMVFGPRLRFVQAYRFPEGAWNS